MTQCPEFEHLLVIPHLRVQNANAVSGSLTHGFPAMTAFLGLMWALERKTVASGLDLRFKAIGVVCHDHQEQITEGDFVHTFHLTRNPVLARSHINNQDGNIKKPDAIVEEGRIHLEISLVFALQSETLTNAFDDAETPTRIAADVRGILGNMRIAGGSVLHSSIAPFRQQPYIVALTGTPEDRKQCFRQLKYRLLPGFTLVARDDLLEERHKARQAENPESSRLDAWLSLSRINCRYTEESGWKHDRDGWIVPIPVGYGILSGPHEAGVVANTRDGKTPFCFVESLYSIGEWLSPHRIRSPEQLLWYADHSPEASLYRCRNDFCASSPEQEDDDSD
ncbi:MAG: type I-F CRISPR-associated protein Csy2 [Zoogloeaceae bacterium]|jgi:CRISPR-associated protein Csy2|nr:type I-F CRISPR-associated protein Csy2 [Zoogloeaceae bacterium]